MASITVDQHFSDLGIFNRYTNKSLVVPVGLNFGPTSASIIFFIYRAEFYTGVPCSELYKRLFQENLSNSMQCNPESHPRKNLACRASSPFTDPDKITELLETLAGYITSALRMGSASIDHNPALRFRLIAITVPDHWDRSARTHVATAAKLAGYPLDSSYVILPLSRGIQSFK